MVGPDRRIGTPGLTDVFPSQTGQPIIDYEMILNICMSGHAVCELKLTVVILHT